MRLKSFCSCSVLSLIVCAAGCGNPVNQVSPTANPQVALYSVVTSAPGSVSVQFGLDTNYGLTTSAQPASPGEETKLFVAGMKANTLYHMRAVVQLEDGTQLMDADNSFRTGALDPTQVQKIATRTDPVMTP